MGPRDTTQADPSHRVCEPSNYRRPAMRRRTRICGWPQRRPRHAGEGVPLMDMWEYIENEGREEEYRRRYQNPRLHAEPLSARARRDFEKHEEAKGNRDE